MKRLVVLLLIVVTLLTLGGCTRKKPETDTADKIRAEYQAYDWDGTDRTKVAEMAKTLKTRIGKLAAAEQEKLKDILEKIEAVLKEGESKVRGVLPSSVGEEEKEGPVPRGNRRLPHGKKGQFPRVKDGEKCPNCRDEEKKQGVA